MRMQSLVESWFRAALRRWPTVRWPLERFGLHVGSDAPRYPEDLYLGGAASERLEEAWSVIHIECRPEVLRRVSRVSSRGSSAEDLWSEAMVRLMAEDTDAPALQDGNRPCRIRRFRGDAPLPGFIAVIAKRYGMDQIRRDAAAERFRSGHALEMERRQADTRDPVMDSELAARFANDFERAFSSLPPSRQALLSLVYGQQLPKSEAGRLLGMRDYKVSRELAASMEALRERLNAEASEAWTAVTTQRWTRLWTEACWHGAEGVSDGA
jgi:RNA polymerase sigma factor (sigma-70 family)